MRANGRRTRGFGFAMVQVAAPWDRDTNSGQFGVVVCDRCRPAFDRDFRRGMFVHSEAAGADDIAWRCENPGAQLAGPHCVRCGAAPRRE